MADKGKNEGEGNRTAARQYNEETRKFVESGQVEAKAKEAKRDLDGPQGAELRQAEEKGRRKAKELDPEEHRDYNSKADG